MGFVYDQHCQNALSCRTVPCHPYRHYGLYYITMMVKVHWACSVRGASERKMAIPKQRYGQMRWSPGQRPEAIFTNVIPRSFSRFNAVTPAHDDNPTNGKPDPALNNQTSRACPYRLAWERASRGRLETNLPVSPLSGFFSIQSCHTCPYSQSRNT